MLSGYIIFLLASIPYAVKSQVNFQPYQNIATGSMAKMTAAGDFNNDGLVDMLTATGVGSNPSEDYRLLIHYQDINGNLGPADTLSYPNLFPGIRGLAVGDINQDSLIDIVAGYDNQIGIYYQLSTGGFSNIFTHTSGNTVYGVEIGDLDDDGMDDIAVSHWNETYVRVFYQTSVQNQFTELTYTKPQAGFDDLAIGDLNGDGLNDLLFMEGQGNGGIHVFTQNNSGTLNAAAAYFPATSGINLHGVAIGDLNQDGYQDVAASAGGNTPNAWIIVWLQDTSTGLLQPTPSEIAAFDIPEAIAIHDLNCDSVNEIIVAHGGWNSLSVYAQNDSGTYSSYTGFNIP